MNVPTDMAGLLSMAVRDILWFQPKVRGFFEECGVSKAVLLEVDRMQQAKTPTLKIVPHVLSRLQNQGEEGAKVIREMFTRIHYWKDMHTVPPDRKDQAIKSLKEFQKAYTKYESQRKFQEEKQARVHAERAARTQMKPLDHARLQGFRDEFDGIHGIQDRAERGNRFQDLMNRIFDYYCDQSKGPFNRTGEQIDGLFYFDNHWYYVEIRWKQEKTSAADISVLRDRAKNAYGGDTKALFVSFNGFSPDCLGSLQGLSDERVILMDGFDLRCVLDCQIALDGLLAEKQLALVQEKRPFISAQEVLARRSKS